LKTMIRVELGKRSYDIIIQNGLAQHCVSLIKSKTRSKKIALLTNSKIYHLLGKTIEKNFKKAGFLLTPILVAEGEKYKNESSLFEILGKLAKYEFQRDSALIALGGGVLGDLGGLASSLYMRGISFFQFPTTLLAQVDASIGGKTAIDYRGIKNLIGSFHQPKLVLIDPDILITLDERQFKTGLAEVIKYGVICDERMFKKMEDNVDLILGRNPKILFHLIKRSCEIKARIVSKDENENANRAWLNYGHTLGHAFESYFGYQELTHGEAISYGMWFAGLLSYQLGLCAKNVVARQISLLSRMGLIRRLPSFKPEIVYKRMLLDKKARKGRVQFVLTRKIGLVTIQKNIPHSTILSALTRLQAEASELS